MELSDQTLIDETRAGSQAAFGMLMRRYERLVYSVGYSYARDADSALDISQDVFLKAYRKLDSYSGRGPFKSWLLRITNNEAVSWLRKNRRHQDHDELSAASVPAAPPDQEINLARREHRELLLGEMQALNPRQRAAITLRYFQDMSIREISDALECSDGVVKSILFRSLEKLRNQLTPLRREDNEGLSTPPDDNPELRSG